MQSNLSKKPISIGEVPFTREDMKLHLSEFSEVYSKRPIQDNQGGMKAPQAFHAWYVAKKLKPPLIIESGVWYGQGTWFFEQACPAAKIICIEPDQARIMYRSDKALYVQHDFKNIEWNTLSVDRSKVLCFFDDHQDALSRLPILQKYGFQHVMFEDNYPVGQGDCVSLKTSLETGGDDEKMVRDFLSVYSELPPPVKLEKTRWGDFWDNYPTEPPLIEDEESEPCYQDGAENYTWICYGRLK